MNRKDFLPNGQEPITQNDLNQTRALLFDPELSSTSERITNGQLNPGNPDECWTANEFIDTAIQGSTSIHSSSEIPLQPCFHCRVNFVCYSKFSQKDSGKDITDALATIANLSRK